MGKYNSKEMAERSFRLDIRGKIAKWKILALTRKSYLTRLVTLNKEIFRNRTVSLKSDVRSIAHRVASKKRLL